jgi:CRP-like cAMP-binding protein
MNSIIDSKRCNDPDYISQIVSLCDNSSTRFYRKNDMIFSEKTNSKGVYYIISGKVKLFKTNINKRMQIVRFASQGDILGVKSAITGHNNSVSATAIEDLLVCVIPKDSFMDLLASTPDLAYYLIDCLSNSLLDVENRTLSIMQKTERERLAEALVQISDKFQSNEIRLLKSDLADFTSIGKDELRGFLINFRDHKLIALNSERIKILDKNGLRELAHVVA